MAEFPCSCIRSYSLCYLPLRGTIWCPRTINFSYLVYVGLICRVGLDRYGPDLLTEVEAETVVEVAIHVRSLQWADVEECIFIGDETIKASE